jgi:hypothetical protein
MSKPPPDRAEEPNRKVGPNPSSWTEGAMPLNIVRGGGVCEPSQHGGHILRGSMQPAVCMPTPGPDPRPRYRQAGKIGGKARHSTHFLQHRKPGE